MIDIGISILVGAFITSLSVLFKEVFNNVIFGLWIKLSGEIREGDMITLKTDFSERTGEVEEIYLRNVVLSLENDTDREMLIEASKVLDEDVIRRRSS